MRQLAPFAVVYLLLAALVLPASPFAADDLAAPAEQAPTDTPEQPATDTAEQQARAPTPAPAEVAQQQPAGEPQAAASQEKAAPAKQPVARAAAPGSVTIKDFSFSPGTITVNVGDSVTWTNNGPSAHSATARDGSFDTGVFGKGKSRAHTFTQAGSFAFICTPHPFMKGTVRVVASGAGGGGSSSSGSGGSGGSGAGTSSDGSAAAPGSNASSGSSGSSGSGASLPNTGSDAGALALLGLMLLGLGAAARRRAA